MYEGLWLFKENNYSAFKDRMDLIRNMDKDKYWEQVKDYANYLMSHSDSSPSYELINKSLKTNLLQLWSYGEAKSKSENWIVNRVVYSLNGEVIAFTQILEKNKCQFPLLTK